MKATRRSVRDGSASRIAVSKTKTKTRGTGRQRGSQRRVIDVAQVATEPDKSGNKHRS